VDLTNTQYLDSLEPGQVATIQKVAVDEALYQRLAALGFRVGKSVAVIRRASFNGPLQVRVGNTDIILRRSEAHRIKIKTS
jgi:ferrous iron transport protein A